MAQRRTRISRRMLFIWCLLGGLICLFAPASLTGKLQLAYMYVFSWPLEAGQRFTLATAAVPSLVAVNTDGGEQPVAENQRLKNHIDNLNARLKEAQQQIDELAKLRKTVPQWDRMSVQLADVTITGQAQDFLFINRGRDDGVAPGQYVLGEMSIIGIVSDVSAWRARVKLMTDPTSKIPVTLGDSDLAWIMEGRRGNIAKIRLVPTTYAVHEGDKVYARKMQGLLDVPIVIAEVAQYRKDPADPLLWDITVRPVCNIAGLTRVAVIVPASQQP